MRQVADQLLVHLRLLQQALLTLLPGLLLHRQELDDHLIAAIGRGNDHMYRQVFRVVLAAQRSLVAQCGEFVGLHPLQRLSQGLCVHKVVCHQLPLQGAPGLTERVFQGGVDRQHASLCIQHRDGRGQQVKGGVPARAHGAAPAPTGRRAISRCRLSMSRCERSSAALRLASGCGWIDGLSPGNRALAACW